MSARPASCSRRKVAQSGHRAALPSASSPFTAPISTVGYLAMRGVIPGHAEATLLEDDGHVILDAIDAFIFIV